jgi:hypothetical protein
MKLALAKNLATVCMYYPSGYSRHLEGLCEENHLPRARYRRVIEDNKNKNTEFVALLGP